MVINRAMLVPRTGLCCDWLVRRFVAKATIGLLVAPWRIKWFMSDSHVMPYEAGNMEQYRLV